MRVKLLMEVEVEAEGAADADELIGAAQAFLKDVKWLGMPLAATNSGQTVYITEVIDVRRAE